jgi:hypothetical protein
VHQSSAVDLALMTDDELLLTDLERSIGKSAKAHEANTFSRLRAIPGGGTIVALGLREDSPDLHRFPTVQAFGSYGRRGTGAAASAGQRYGTSGTTIGHAHPGRPDALPGGGLLFIAGHV